MKTKNILIPSIFLLSLAPLTSVAQSYSSIYGNDSTKWTTHFCNLDQRVTREQIIIQDTVVSGIPYKKAGTVINNSIDYSMATTVDRSNGLSKEDTRSGKAWFLGTIETFEGLDTIEFLIMDLSLNINETFIIYKSFGDSTVAIVDSVYDVSGRKHVRTNYVLPGGNQKLTFIEGIGTNYGLNYMHDDYNMCPCLKIYEKDNDQSYFNNECSLFSEIGSEPLHEYYISIYPHPIVRSGNFKFERTNGVQSELIIFNALGQTVYSYQTSSDYFEITNSLNLTGTYFYHLISDQQFLSSGKISFAD